SPDRVARANSAHRVRHLVHDSRVSRVERYPKPVDPAWVDGETTVTQIHAKQVDVAWWQVVPVVAQLSARVTPRPANARPAAREAPVKPVADGGTRDASNPRYLRRIEALSP